MRLAWAQAARVTAKLEGGGRRHVPPASASLLPVSCRQRILAWHALDLRSLALTRV